MIISDNYCVLSRDEILFDISEIIDRVNNLPYDNTFVVDTNKNSYNLAFILYKLCEVFDIHIENSFNYSDFRNRDNVFINIMKIQNKSYIVTIGSCSFYRYSIGDLDGRAKTENCSKY